MIKEVKTGIYFKGEESFNFDFYTNLSASDKLIFVNSVVDTVVNENRYNSIIRNLMFDYILIQVFTNVDTSFLVSVDEKGNIITDIDLLEEFLEETNIVDVVKANMEVGLLEELNKAVDLNIEYLTGVHPSPLNDTLTSLMNTLERKINEVDLNSMMEMASKFSGMTEEFTPENIVKAYMTTDTYKKNVSEIEKSKESKAKIADDIDKVVSMVEKVDKKPKKSAKTTKK